MQSPLKTIRHIIGKNPKMMCLTPFLAICLLLQLQLHRLRWHQPSGCCPYVFECFKVFLNIFKKSQNPHKYWVSLMLLYFFYFAVFSSSGTIWAPISRSALKNEFIFRNFRYRSLSIYVTSSKLS